MAQIKDSETDRLVVLLPKALKRRLKLAARELEDIGDDDATITRIVVELLGGGIDEYEKALKKRVAKFEKDQGGRA